MKAERDKGAGQKVFKMKVELRSILKEEEELARARADRG